MIDEEWLAEQRFTTFDGHRVVGLLGVGSEHVTFEVQMSNGASVARQTRLDHLGYHIRALPLFLTGKPAYDLDRLALKLSGLRGAPALDAMTKQYNRLHSVIIKILHQHGVAGVLAASYKMITLDFALFLLKTPGVRRRLAEFTALADRVEHNGFVLTDVKVNEPFPISAERVDLKRWAASMLEQIDELRVESNHLQPDTLPDNPLYVWGAAVTDGFVTDSEMERAAAFVDRPFTGPNQPDVTLRYQEQALAIAHLLDHLLTETDVERFVRFCWLAGYQFTLNR
ncbi:hypothetical protein ACH4U5_26965 [Streptomyces sp. NPDC020858]|uniref:hypothetical protein n=1 Tax=Streptomyces sp. NPDC020858 TaxID=3365097 RepID=UPI0037B90277